MNTENQTKLDNDVVEDIADEQLIKTLEGISSVIEEFNDVLFAVRSVINDIVIAPTLSAIRSNFMSSDLELEYADFDNIHKKLSELYNQSSKNQNQIESMRGVVTGVINSVTTGVRVYPELVHSYTSLLRTLLNITRNGVCFIPSVKAELTSFPPKVKDSDVSSQSLIKSINDIEGILLKCAKDINGLIDSLNIIEPLSNKLIKLPETANEALIEENSE
jgi:hypothetical protein